MNTRHRLQFVDLVGLKPLSGCVFHWSHMQQAQKQLFLAEKLERQQCNAGGLTFCGSCATNRTQNALNFDTCKGFVHDLTILAIVWAADGVVPRSGTIGL